MYSTIKWAHHQNGGKKTPLLIFLALLIMELLSHSENMPILCWMHFCDKHIKGAYISKHFVIMFANIPPLVNIAFYFICNILFGLALLTLLWETGILCLEDTLHNSSHYTFAQCTVIRLKKSIVLKLFCNRSVKQTFTALIMFNFLNKFSSYHAVALFLIFMFTIVIMSSGLCILRETCYGKHLPDPFIQMPRH